MLLLASALALAAGEVSWDFLGTTAHGLRLFVDRASIAGDAGLIGVTIRLGSPQPIVRDIVKIVQEEEIDCRGNRWRLLGYRAFDENDRIVAERPFKSAAEPFRIEEGSISATVRDAVCTHP